MNDTTDLTTRQPASPLVVWSALYPDYTSRMEAIANSCIERVAQKGGLELEQELKLSRWA